MKKVLVWFSALVMLGVSVNAEVFIKDQHEINYVLTAEKLGGIEQVPYKLAYTFLNK